MVTRGRGNARSAVASRGYTPPLPGGFSRDFSIFSGGSMSSFRRLAAHAAALLSLAFVAGWFGLAALALVRWRHRAELVPVVLMPVAALAGMLYYATRWPTTDADTVKGVFALPALPFLAIASAWLLDILGARLPRVLAVMGLAVLGISLAISLEFVWW